VSVADLIQFFPGNNRFSRRNLVGQTRIEALIPQMAVEKWALTPFHLGDVPVSLTPRLALIGSQGPFTLRAFRIPPTHPLVKILRLLDRQVGWLGSAQNIVHQGRKLPPAGEIPRSITDLYSSCNLTARPL
jgi:hypothetical protein